jgi:hypothetical protein
MHEPRGRETRDPTVFSVTTTASLGSGDPRDGVALS